MNLRARTLLCLSLLAMALTGLSAPTATAERQQAGTLRVTPTQAYVGGHAMTFEGDLGVSGARRIGLQFTFGRAGDAWTDVAGFSARTDRSGDFRFVYPAPAAFNVRYRVAGGGAVTDAVTFNARSQDLVLRAVANGGGADNRVVAGQPFTVEVDTTPGPSDTGWARLLRRPDLPPPAYPGRTLTLQQRAGDGWQTLDTTTSGQDGMGYFRGVTVEQPGSVVYRVRQEDWFRDGHEIGWFPSFPTQVQVVAPGARAALAEPGSTTAPGSGPATESPLRAPASTGGASTTAGQRFGWAPAIWDFAFELGESLTSPPARGTDRKGRWLDSATGTGRAVHYNGGLMLDSQRQNDDRVDDSYGTTQVTLAGNPAAYGRWEVRMRTKSTETGDGDYRARIELVPDRAADDACGARTITVADVTAHGSSVGVGVKAVKGKRQWTRTVKGVRINNQSIAYAVEVTKRHISWFIEGKVVGTVKSRAAVSGVPLTLRLSLVGDGQQEMNRTQAQYDFIRGFDLKRGKQVRSGTALKAGTHRITC